MLENKEKINENLIKKFAFLIHFRHDIRDDLKFYFDPLKKVPESFYRNVFERFHFNSVKWGIVQDNIRREKIGKNEIIPLNAEFLLKIGPRKAQIKIRKSIDKLVDQGYGVIGLGALTAPLTFGGNSLSNRKDVVITNGNAYTAVIMHDAVKKLQRKNERLLKTAIVGASGSVGSCLSKQIAKKGDVKELLLVARNLNKLKKLAAELLVINSQLKIKCSIDISDIKNYNLITLLTSNSNSFLKSEFIKYDAVILDGTQPRNTSPYLIKKRPDITVIDGGVVWAPGITLKKGGFGLPSNHFFACFSESVLLALENYNEHFSIGNPSLEHAETIEKIAKKHHQYGFQLSPFLSFGKPLNNLYYN